MNTKPKPCPFCGSDDIRMDESIIDYCYCPDCGVSGPIAKSKERAINFWNQMPRDEEEV